MNNNANAEANSARLLTKADVAALLQVSPRTVERFVRLGRLRALKLSHNLIRFQRADVELFINSAGSLFLCLGDPAQEP
jgi:excisionase family DNA binding protein